MLFNECTSYCDHIASVIDEWVGAEEWLKDADIREPQKSENMLSLYNFIHRSHTLSDLGLSPSRCG